MSLSVEKSMVNKPQKELLAYVGKLGAIWLSWKVIIHILGEQKVPLNERLVPKLSGAWEQLNTLLANEVLSISKHTLAAIEYTAYTYKRTLWITDSPGVTVGNYCLGIQLMFYFAVMVLVTPMSLNRKLIGVVGGVVLVNFLNIIRIIGLALVVHHTPQYLFIAHDHLFNLFVLGCMLPFFWLLVKQKLNNKVTR